MSEALQCAYGKNNFTCVGCLRPSLMTAATSENISPADVGPSQLFQQIDHIGKSGLIISALPELVITQDAPSSVSSNRAVVFLDEADYDWTIFADRVVIRGTIKLAADAAPDSTRVPARSPGFSLFAREIGCESGTKSGFETPSIVVDGTNGTDHNEPFPTAAAAATGKGTDGNYSVSTYYGYHNRLISSIVPSGKGPTGSDGSASPANGGQGGDAGSIRIVAESLLQPLSLSATGGDGGRGQHGQQGGTGGPGGDGHGSDGNRVFICWETLHAVSAGVGGDGGNGGPGGAGGAPGKGGAVACKLVKSGLDCVHVNVNAGNAGVAGAPGDGGLPGPPGRGASNCWYIVRDDNYPFFIQPFPNRATDISPQDAAAPLLGAKG